MPNVQSFDQFLQFLNDNKVPNRVNLQDQVIELPSNAAPLPGNLIVKWEKKIPFVQMVHFMIENVPVDRIRDVETAIVRLDNRLEVGGFGFDHAQNRLYCRLTIPVFPPDGINPMTINQLGHGIVRNAKEFLAVLQEIVAGASGEKVVELFEASTAKRKAAEPPSGAQA
jgi:hypothetical protein